MGVTDVIPVLSTSRRCCSAPGLAADGRSGGGPAQALWPGRGSWALSPEAFWPVQRAYGCEPRAGAGGPRQEGEATRVGEATGCWPGSASQTCPPSPLICGTHLQPRTFARTNLLAVSSSALLSPHPCGSITRPLPAPAPGLSHFCTFVPGFPRALAFSILPKICRNPTPAQASHGGA